jgi:hypothetical protein
MQDSFDGEIYDHDSRETELHKLSVAMEELILFRNTLLDEGGISAGMVVALESISPDVIDTSRYPTESFTKDPSLTNYKVATESVTGAIGSFLKQIWEAIAKFFKSVAGFFASLWERVTGKAKQLETTEAETIQVEKDTVYLLEHLPGDVKQNVKKELAEFDRRYDETFATALSNINNDFVQSWIHQDYLYRALTDFAGCYVDYIKGVSNRINTFIGLAKGLAKLKVEGEPILMEAINHELRTLPTSHNFSVFVNQANHLKFTDVENVMPLSDPKDPLVIARLLWKVKSVSKRLFNKTTHDSPSLNSLTPISHYHIPHYEQIEGAIRGLKTDYFKDRLSVNTDVSDPEVTRLFTKFSHLVRMEFDACVGFMEVANAIYNVKIAVADIHNTIAKRKQKIAQQKAAKYVK